MENKKRLTIAILLGDTYTEYATELIRGFYACAQKEQVNLIFLMRSSIPRDTNTILSGMTGEDFQVHFSSIYDYIPLFKPDALILAYGSLSIFSDTPAKETLFSFYKDIPCLLLKDISDDPDIPYLVADNYTGMRECIEHLITVHGYQKIAFLAGPANNHDSNERLRAYYEVMQENGLDVTSDMVTHGDYSDSVDDQVSYLLDSNPGLEAIAFANDNMAKAGYRVCNQRGIVVGRDLAITGFDDVNMAKAMNPPLSSVMHNSFLFSYHALQNAIQMCNGIKPTYNKLRTLFHPRTSCGCSTSYDQTFSPTSSTDEILQFIHASIDDIVEDFFFSFPYEEEKLQYRDLLIHFFDALTVHAFENTSEQFTINSQSPYLERLCEHPRISPLIMLDHLLKLLNKLIPFATDEAIRSSLLRIITSTQHYVYSYEIQAQRTRSRQNLQQNWFANSFTQDLMTSQVNLDECLLRIMNRLKLMNIRSCYFFLLSEPAEREKAFRLEPPDNLHLAAYYHDDTTVQMAREDWIPIHSHNGISHYLPPERSHLFTTYVLFSGNTQYGFIICENEPQDISFMLTCSLQIGSFLRFYYLRENEISIRKELETSLKLIKEQNSILNFISEYDELTHLLNRRGFMEKAFSAINKNVGKTAYVLFGDLDHLKEINDCFGHSAGDFAIQTAANYLRNCLAEDSIIARISGDEFVAFAISDEEDYEQLTKQAIKDSITNFNKTCDKPYYIEMSLGIYKFNCSSTAPITELLHESDTLLYEEKKNRRTTVKKEV